MTWAARSLGSVGISDEGIVSLCADMTQNLRSPPAYSHVMKTVRGGSIRTEALERVKGLSDVPTGGSGSGGCSYPEKGEEGTLARDQKRVGRRHWKAQR